jgi:hypothetical protein
MSLDDLTDQVSPRVSETGHGIRWHSVAHERIDIRRGLLCLHVPCVQAIGSAS